MLGAERRPSIGRPSRPARCSPAMPGSAVITLPLRSWIYDRPASLLPWVARMARLLVSEAPWCRPRRARRRYSYKCDRASCDLGDLSMPVWLAARTVISCAPARAPAHRCSRHAPETFLKISGPRRPIPITDRRRSRGRGHAVVAPPNRLSSEVDPLAKRLYGAVKSSRSRRTAACEQPAVDTPRRLRLTSGIERIT